MKHSILFLCACIIISALSGTDSYADTGASFSAGAETKLPIMGVSKFGETRLGVVTIPSGDLNGDGIVDISDALLALQIIIGLKTATTVQMSAGDVAPLANGKPVPNGILDLSDAVVMLKKAVGLLTW